MPYHDSHHEYDAQEYPSMSVKPAVIITGASTGIGAVYADRSREFVR
jgi:NADP-dependent 3-hydroxy acid dehydrogenase YdfG